MNCISHIHFTISTLWLRMIYICHFQITYKTFKAIFECIFSLKPIQAKNSSTPTSAAGTGWCSMAHRGSTQPFSRPEWPGRYWRGAPSGNHSQSNSWVPVLDLHELLPYRGQQQWQHVWQSNRPQDNVQDISALPYTISACTRSSCQSHAETCLKAISNHIHFLWTFEISLNSAHEQNIFSHDVIEYM